MLKGTLIAALAILIAASYQTKVFAQAAVGTWILKSDDNPSPARSTAICKRNGSGSYQLPNATYPSRCYYSGSAVTIKVWAYPEDVEVTAPPIILKLNAKLNHISGISVRQNGERYSGARQGTRGRTQSEMSGVHERPSKPLSSAANESNNSRDDNYIAAQGSTSSEETEAGKSYFYVQCSGEKYNGESGRSISVFGISQQKSTRLDTGKYSMSLPDREQAEQDFYRVYMNWSPQNRNGNAASNCQVWENSATPGKTGTLESARSNNTLSRNKSIKGHLESKGENYLFKEFN